LNRGNGVTALGLRRREMPPETRELEIELPVAAWQLLEADAKLVDKTVAEAISDLITDLCADASAPPRRSRQPKRKGATP
jgi:hypothetical protein